MNTNEKHFADGYGYKFEDYRDFDQKKKKITLKNLNKLKIHNRLSKLDSNNTQTNFDATSLYSSAIYNGSNVYSKKGTGYVFKLLMNDIFVNDFIDKTFNQDGNDSAILKLNYYSSQNLTLQPLPVE